MATRRTTKTAATTTAEARDITVDNPVDPVTPVTTGREPCTFCGHPHYVVTGGEPRGHYVRGPVECKRTEDLIDA